MGKSAAEKIWAHPDREELISKLCSGVDVKEVAEWLSAKYDDVGSKDFALPIRVISDFKKNNLDFYAIMKADLAKVSSNKLSNSSNASAEIAGTSAYKMALEKYANSEVDIKRMINNLCASIEMRFEQVFNELQNDVSNFKFDRVLIEYAAVLKDTLKDCNDIVNGPAIAEQINITNNLNVAVLDTHINSIYDIIREILTMLDYDTSIKFVEMFNERMTALKKAGEIVAPIPIEKRLVEAQNLHSIAETKFSRIE